MIKLERRAQCYLLKLFVGIYSLRHSDSSLLCSCSHDPWKVVYIMSWFDNSFSFARTALSQAQKSIDKVLDIREGDKDPSSQPKAGQGMAFARNGCVSLLYSAWFYHCHIFCTVEARTQSVWAVDKIRPSEYLLEINESRLPAVTYIIRCAQCSSNSSVSGNALLSMNCISRCNNNGSIRYSLIHCWELNLVDCSEKVENRNRWNQFSSYQIHKIITDIHTAGG